MKTIDLDNLSDSEIEKVIAEGQLLLKVRGQQRREDALEAARAKLAEAGLTPQDLINATRKRPAPSTALASGQKFVNPDNPKETWTSGRGRRPAWFKALEKKGQVPPPV